MRRIEMIGDDPMVATSFEAFHKAIETRKPSGQPLILVDPSWYFLNVHAWLMLTALPMVMQLKASQPLEYADLDPHKWIYDRAGEALLALAQCVDPSTARIELRDPEDWHRRVLSKAIQLVDPKNEEMQPCLIECA